MSGSLRNSRGTKVTVILLDTVMVVGRTVSRPGIGKIIQVRHQLTINQLMNRSINQVYRDPIPLHCLGYVDLADAEAVKPASFHHHVTLYCNAIHQPINDSISQPGVRGSPPPTLPGLCGSGRWGGNEAWILTSSYHSLHECYPSIN